MLTTPPSSSSSLGKPKILISPNHDLPDEVVEKLEREGEVFSMPGSTATLPLAEDPSTLATANPLVSHHPTHPRNKWYTFHRYGPTPKLKMKICIYVAKS